MARSNSRTPLLGDRRAGQGLVNPCLGGPVLHTVSEANPSVPLFDAMPNFQVSSSGDQPLPDFWGRIFG